MKTDPSKLVKVTKVKAKGFTLVCEFQDGVVVEYDMSWVKEDDGEMVQGLKAPKAFAAVFVDRGVPTWPNGFDVSPSTIYRDGARVKRRRAS